MSTRSRIIICANDPQKEECLYLYHHCDGYPSGVGSELSEILSQCPLPWSPQAVQKFINEYNDDYEITDYGINWDDEYYYVINCEKRTLSGFYKGITTNKETFYLTLDDELLIPGNLFSSDRKSDADKEAVDKIVAGVKAELEKQWQQNISRGVSAKEMWIADVAVKILASCPYPYMSLDGFNSIPAAEYAAEQAKRMADKIFG